MIAHYQDLCHRAIAMYTAGPETVGEKIRLFAAITEVSEFLRQEAAWVERVDIISLAAHGIRYNPITGDAARAAKDLLDFVPSLPDILRYGKIPGETRSYLSLVADPSRKDPRGSLELGLKVLEKMQEAVENSEYLYAASVRYSEDSELWKYSPSTSTFYYLCLIDMTITTYRFHDFECFISATSVSEKDLSEWSTRRKIIPELYA